GPPRGPGSHSRGFAARRGGGSQRARARAGRRRPVARRHASAGRTWSRAAPPGMSELLLGKLDQRNGATVVRRLCEWRPSLLKVGRCSRVFQHRFRGVRYTVPYDGGTVRRARHAARGERDHELLSKHDSELGDAWFYSGGNSGAVKIIWRETDVHRSRLTDLSVGFATFRVHTRTTHHGPARSAGSRHRQQVSGRLAHRVGW